MDLFKARGEEIKGRRAPLAFRMRPRTLEEYIGQEHIIGPGKLLRRSIEADRLGSMIFYGPPGTGKTSLALLLAQYSQAHFAKINAVTAGVADIRKLIAEANDRWSFHQQKTMVFVDEIHRFNKGQQDALLPAVEDGTILLLGATTENPSYEVNSPLLSRCRVFSLSPLREEDMKEIIIRALKDKERGLGKYQVDLRDEAFEHLVKVADGDARIALNGLELAVLSRAKGEDDLIIINGETIEDSLQQGLLRYDQEGEEHYNTVSAFIKSIRGSNPDAALYYMLRMLEAGEDPKFIARRMIVHAAEDIGLADPQALLIAVSAAKALEMVGLPEARIPMAQACIYLATAPKSNAVLEALLGARADLKNMGNCPIPDHLKEGVSKKFTSGPSYLYPHDYPGNFVQQEYLPEKLKGKKYYKPSSQGYEKELEMRLKGWYAVKSPRDKDEKK